MAERFSGNVRETRGREMCVSKCGRDMHSYVEERRNVRRLRERSRLEDMELQ